MTVVADKIVVSIDYTLKDDSGSILDQSPEGEPLRYLHGAHNIIPGLENALVGKAQGESVAVVVEPEDGYGPVEEDFVQEVDKSIFEGVEEVNVGMAFEAMGPEGQSQRVMVTKVDGDKITVDGNHPLAGARLHFDVTITELRDATPEELDHGHVH